MMGEEADADWQDGLVEWGRESVKPKMTKLKVQAQCLQVGDIVGSGETVEYVGRGLNTPNGCVDVTISKGDKKRTTYWRRYTMIGVERKQNENN